MILAEGGRRSARSPATLRTRAAPVLGSRNDGDAPERSQLPHGLVTGHDHVGLPADRDLEHLVAWLAGQYRHLLRRLGHIHAHLQEFTLAGQTRLCDPDPDWEIAGEITEDYQRVKLSRLRPGEQFVYVFDLGEDWPTYARLARSGSTRSRPGLMVRLPRIGPVWEYAGPRAV